MGQILSHSEVDAILSALDFTASQPTSPPAGTGPSGATEVTLYDFEHPVPLRPSQLDGLRNASAAASRSIQAGLTSVLHSSVVINFLGVEQSTFHDYLATTERPACLAMYESTTSLQMCLLDISRTLAFTIIDCQLGGQPSKTEQTLTLARPFTEVETRLIDKAICVILPALLGEPFPRNSLRLARLVSDGSLIFESTSNEAVALITYEVQCGPNQGLMQLCVPWKQIAQTHLPVLMERRPLQEIMRPGAIKVPLVATARLATLKLSTHEFASLNPGDVLLTDASPLGELSLEVDGHAIFRGTLGQSHDRKVVQLTTPVTPLRSTEGFTDDFPVERPGSILS